MRQNRSFTQDIDWISVILFGLLLIVGWVNIYAADFSPKHPSIFDLSMNYGKQLLWIGIALVLAMVIMIIDSNFYTAVAFILYGITLFALIIVFLVARDVHGARAWIDIGGFKLQPSEFSKFATSLALAKYLSTLNISLKSPRTRWITFAIILVPMALIVLQSDTGSALVFTAFFLVLYREGFPGVVYLIGFLFLILSVAALYLTDFIQSHPVQLIITVTSIAVISFGISLVYKKYRRLFQILAIFTVAATAYFFVVELAFDHVLQEHQKVRINVVLGKVHDKRGVEYNVEQSKMAIGSGGLRGKGFKQGTMTVGNFVPVQSTDFIFCTIGEEWGFLGTTVLILIFIFLMIRIFIIAERQRSKFSRIYAYCVACIFFIHFTINIGMTIGIIPVIGIPLPFVSYGGSSMLSFTILLFILLRLDSNRLLVLR